MVNQQFKFKFRWTALALTLLCAAMVLGACAGTDGGSDRNGEPISGNSAADHAPAEDAGANNGAAVAETAASDDGQAAYPRTVTDARGSVVLKSPPKKVALVHWGLTDDLLVFDLDSIAVTLPFTKERSSLGSEIYKPYVDKHAQIEIVGENTQVNLEVLLAYGPDLIIAGSDTNKDILDRLPAIATTVVLDEAATNVFQDWRSVITRFGEILGQEDVAKQYIADFDAKVADAKSKMGKVDGTVAFIQVREKQVWLQGTAYLTEYYDGFGLTPLSGDTAEEGAELSLEGLSVLDPDYLFLGYFNMEDTSLPALTDEWESSQVWKKLKAVQNGHVYGFNGQIAFGFGPISKSYGVDEIGKALR